MYTLNRFKCSSEYVCILDVRKCINIPVNMEVN
jgi:hypothetical protein